MDRPLVQILVEVANIQTRTLKAEMGKGSMCTTVEHGTVDTKLLPSTLNVKVNKLSTVITH